MDRVMCGEGSLPCWFWPLGLLFLFLPTIVQSISIFSGRVDGWIAMDTKYKILLGPLYILGAPGLAIKLTGETFCCGETRGEDAMMDWLAYCKLAEVLFEAVPQVTVLLPLSIQAVFQVCLSYGYLWMKGLPWPPTTSASNWAVFCSAITSTIMILCGTVTGLKAAGNILGCCRGEANQIDGQKKMHSSPC